MTAATNPFEGAITVSKFLELRTEGHLVVATLNRPERRNALSTPICEGLRALATRAEDDVEIRVIVITGAGESFCAGADLKERRELGPGARWEYVEGTNRTIRKLESAAVPVIGAVNGFALGGGVELLLACDYRIAVKTATFGLPETALGIIPGGSQVRLLQEIGPSKMAWMTYTAERFDARRALKIGLIDEVVEDGETLTQRSMELARAIALNAPLALRAAKKLKRRLQDTFIETGMVSAEEVRAPLDDTQDCLEGLSAFKDKRAPRFQGR